VKTLENESKVSKAQQKAVNKYIKSNYDRINVTLPKGIKEEIQAAAVKAGESVNGYIKVAIDERMERERSSTDK
jgi:predicted HicB family RNase H-like nuclease